jgi:sulfopyruvate decarboxylase subunit alpha
VQVVLRRSGICGLLDSMSQTNCRLLPSVLALSLPFLECAFRMAHEPAIKLLRYQLLLFLRLDALVVAQRRGLNVKPCKQALKPCHVLLGVCAILMLVGQERMEISECITDIVKSQTPCQHRYKHVILKIITGVTSILFWRAAMPVSINNSRLIFEALKACDIKIISALPETWLVHLIRMAEEDPTMTLVRLAKEEEGVGISAGAHLAGVNSAMLMQNHGFLASINGIVSLALLYRIPLLLLISYRGHMGEKDPWQTQGGLITESILRALNIPTWHLTDSSDIYRRLKDAQTLAHASLHPVAVLLTRELMWED